MADEEQPPLPFEGQSSDPPPPDAPPDGQPEDEQQAPAPDDAPPPPPQGAADFLARTGLLDVPWYHGMIPLEDLQRMLTQNGYFLLRMEADEGGEFRLVVSVFWEGLVKNYDIREMNAGQFTFDHTVAKPSVKELILHYQNALRPLQPGGAQLVNPVRRQAWELRRADITQEQKLGEGAFGEVYKGTLKWKDGNVIAVAIKTPKKAVGKDVIAEAMKEARIQKDYVHPNVLRLFGVSAEMEPLMIVLEFVDGGSLESYLKIHADKITPAHQATFCFDVTCGLDYLHERNCIHRDIATRNCLLSAQYFIVKISDFGLSSVGNVQTLDRSKPAPIRWLGPEVMETCKYTKAADIWSLAVVYWEIFTFAREPPYKELSMAEVQAKLRSDPAFRLQLPPICPPDIKNLARHMWNSDPLKRPTAKMLHAKLSPYANKERFLKVPGIDAALLDELSKKKKRKSQKSRASTTGGTKEASVSKEQPVSKELPPPARAPAQVVRLGKPPSVKKKAPASLKNRQSGSRKSKKNATVDSKERPPSVKKRSARSNRK